MIGDATNIAIIPIGQAVSRSTLFPDSLCSYTFGLYFSGAFVIPCVHIWVPHVLLYTASLNSNIHEKLYIDNIRLWVRDQWPVTTQAYVTFHCDPRIPERSQKKHFEWSGDILRYVKFDKKHVLNPPTLKYLLIGERSVFFYTQSFTHLIPLPFPSSSFYRCVWSGYISNVFLFDNVNASVKRLTKRTTPHDACV